MINWSCVVTYHQNFIVQTDSSSILDEKALQWQIQKAAV